MAGRPPQPEELWWTEACEIMVRENLSFRRAAEQLGKVLLPADCSLIERRKAFQRVLYQVRYRYYESLGADPNRTKSVMLGQGVHCVQKLVDDGQHDKALSALVQLLKLEYNIQDNAVNVFSGFTQKDFDELRSKIKRLNEPAPSEGPSKPN